MSTNIPPQNLEAERAVLGGVLQDNRCVLELPPALKTESFYMPSHGQIFAAMLDLWGREAPIDVASVSTHAGVSAAVLAEIYEAGMPRSIGYHANLVITAARERRALEVVQAALCELQE